MRDLKDVLTKVANESTHNHPFKDQLRARLLVEMNGGSRFRTPFLWASAAALAFFFITALMVADPDEAPSPGSEIWRAMFDLTECELIIAEGLVSGRRINDIATERGVSIETVRSQTKRMFERLNVSSQAEAAARLSRAAPFRRPLRTTP